MQLTFEERSEFEQGCIIRVFEPTLYEDAVVRLQREVFCYIVNDDCFVKRSSDLGEVFDEDHAGRAGMLAVEPVRDVLRLVNGVQDPVGVVLHGRCEDHDLIDFRHLLEELLAARPDSKRAFAGILIVMYKSLVEVEHQRIAVGILRWP